MIQVGRMHDVVLEPDFLNDVPLAYEGALADLNILSADSHPGSHGHARWSYAALIFTLRSSDRSLNKTNKSWQLLEEFG